MMISDQSQHRTAAVPAFDFDAWVKLARENPEGFERFRQRAIRAALASFDDAEPRHLRALCNQVDRFRSSASSPLASSLELAEQD